MSPSSSVSTRSRAFWEGVRCASGTPAAVLFAGMVGFGATGHQNGFDVWLLSLCSLLMFALPGQIVMLEMLAGGSAWLAIMLAVTLTSSRFVTMAVTLFPQLHPRDRGPKLLAATHLMAMTSWALSMRDFVHLPRRHRFSYYMGVGVPCFLVAAPGTYLGYHIAGMVPTPVNLALVFLNPLFFLLTCTEVKPALSRLAIGLGCLLGPAFYLWHPESSLLTTGLCAGTLAYGLDRFWRHHRSIHTA